MSESQDAIPLPLHSPDHIRQIERSRVRALVERNMELAWKLHSAEYQLITPSGKSYTREQYLGYIAAGELVYRQWLPEDMDVRLSATMAIVRYRATIELDAGKGHGTPFRCWHMDAYELSGGSWRAIWSQATIIK
jgi:hypothetical protein